MGRVPLRPPAFLLLVVSFAASAAEPDPYRFWKPERRESQRAYEAEILAAPDASRLRAFHDLVSSATHVAGTPGDARVVGALVGTLQDLGLRVEKQDLWLYLARPLRAEVEIVSPRRLRLPVREDVLREDPWSAHTDIDPGWNAWSGSGEAEGPVVYANFGTKEDFERLRGLGVGVKGKVVLARYGGNFRGYKARFAEEAGAAALVIFSDPAESGYVKGLVYPEGGWAHPSEIQRGSLLTLPYPGDPLTPFVPAVRDAKRLDPAALALPRIPVQPIGGAAASEILSRMAGPPVPSGWQGGLPFTYRTTGGDALRLRVRVEQERKILETANVVATLEGARFPEEKVILGSHHDAWTFGAADPNAGTIVVLEAARAFALAAQHGRRPDRSIVFANWGAEEFGIEGSTEWVEAHRDELARGGVAYINLDSAALGLAVGAAASPSLKTLIAEAARAIPQPKDAAGRSVFEAWKSRRADPERPGQPAMDDLGGGSDHVGFLCHVGVPSAGLGAGGAEGTAYHSAYDDLAWYRKVVGDDYASGVLVTKLTALVAARLATADVLPLDPPAYGLDARRHLAEMARLATERGQDVDLGPAEAEAAHFERRAGRAMDETLRLLERRELGEDDLGRTNARLLEAERLWLDPGGLPDRPWYRSLWAAPDADAGYASWMLPGLRDAVERKDAARVEAALRRLVAVFVRLGDTVVAPEPLGERVSAALAGFHGKVSLYARNLDTGRSYGLRADERVRSASTIKLAILVEAFARVAEGRARWTDPLVLTDAKKAAGAGVLPEMAEGLRLTLRDAVNLMIVVSDNTATNLVLDELTTDAVNARLAALGFEATRCLRKIGGGGASRAGADPANQAFGIGVTTPREMVTLLERLERGDIVSPDASHEMIELLKRQQYRDGIFRGFKGLPAATKPGALDHLRSDVGILYTPRGRVAMAVTCEDLPEVDYSPDNPAFLLMSRLSLVLADGLAGLR
jgi:N-acetylated-alpha-linked acidic dipeptidase